MRNNAYHGPSIPSIDPSSAEAFSRLEEEWKNRHTPLYGSKKTTLYPNGSSPSSLERSDGAEDDDNPGYVIAGSLVREALQDDNI